MATLNLGRIKPVFRDAYSGSTAYVVDDIVTHGDECFICIQAHGAGEQATSQTAYWKKLAAKGTDGTDVGTTITTQGDILYRDGSGLQRLAKPASDKFLQNTSGGVLSWETVSSTVLKVESFQDNTRADYSGSSYQTIMSGNYTKLSASSKILLFVSLNTYGEANGGGTHQFNLGTSSAEVGTHYGKTNHSSQISQLVYISNNTQTGSLAWTFRVKDWGVQHLNPTNSDHSQLPSTPYPSTLTIMEYA